MGDIDNFVFGIIAAGGAISIIIIGFFAWTICGRKRAEHFSVSNLTEPTTGFDIVYLRAPVNHSRSHSQPVSSEKVFDNDVQIHSIKNTSSPDSATEMINSTDGYVSGNDPKLPASYAPVRKYSLRSGIKERMHSSGNSEGTDDPNMFVHDIEEYSVNKYSSHTTRSPSKNSSQSHQTREIYENNSKFSSLGQTNAEAIHEKSPVSSDHRKQLSDNGNAQNTTFQNGEVGCYTHNYERQELFQLTPAFNVSVASPLFTYI